MDDKPKFNQKEYINNYKKQNYKQFSLRVKPELKDRIDKYCKDMNISQSEFLKLAIDTLEEM